MRSLTRSVAAVCGALLLAVTVVGCSKEGEEEPGFSTVSPSTTEEAAEEEDISATQENSKESAPECTEAALERDLGEGNALGWTILECEGDFAFVAHKSSDYLVPIIWENGGWKVIPEDGQLQNALLSGCYDQSTVDRLGIGPKVRSHMDNCATGTTFDNDAVPADHAEYITSVGLGEAIFPVSYPKCDGRYILILDSIVDDPSLGDTRQRLTEAVAFVGPDGEEGKEFTVPGQCDSLRKQVDGHDIYPVYLDFWKDKSAACSAKSRYGGNVRPLIDGDFASGNNQSVDEARLALDPC